MPGPDRRRRRDPRPDEPGYGEAERRVGRVRSLPRAVGQQRRIMTASKGLPLLFSIWGLGQTLIVATPLSSAVRSNRRLAEPTSVYVNTRGFPNFYKGGQPAVNSSPNMLISFFCVFPPTKYF